MNVKHWIAGALSAALLLCSGCTTSPAATETPAPTSIPTAAPTPLPTAAPEHLNGVYTFDESLSALPLCWDPHSWGSESDRRILLYTTAPLLSQETALLPEGGVGYRWSWELAESLEDITENWAQTDQWGIQPGETGRVWRLRLRESACWDDGDRTPITAQSFVDSMRLCLDPARQCPRAEHWIAGEAALAGGAAYYHAGASVWTENAKSGAARFPYESWELQDGQFRGAGGADLWFNLEARLSYWLGGSSLGDYYRAGYLPEDIYLGLQALENEDGYIPATRESADLLYRFIGSEAWGFESENSLDRYALYRTDHPPTAWEQVGLLAEDDYTLLYITAEPVSEYGLRLALTEPFLVHPAHYEALSFSYEGRRYTDYATSPETAVSCGPYRVASVSDTRVVLERNESWYGYELPGRSGEFAADRVVEWITPTRSSALALYENGTLDLLRLEDADLDAYMGDPQLIRLESAFVDRLILVTDRDALLVLQQAAGDGINKTCLANESFRRGISLAIDREQLAAESTLGGSSALGLLNGTYLLHGSDGTPRSYRSTAEGMTAICQSSGLVWGHESDYATLEDAYSACTGWDLTLARQCFRTAYDQMRESGDWADGMQIELRCAAANETLSPSLLRQQELLQGFLSAAARGTGFDGRLTITFCAVPDRFQAVADGQIELALGAWGGAAFEPWQMLQCWCDPELNPIQEGCGFRPSTTLLTLLLDEEPVTKTYTEWARSILPGGVYGTDEAQRLAVLGGVEAALLRQRCCIPLLSEGDALLTSGQVEPLTRAGSLLWGWGGLRSLRFLLDDGQWHSTP